MAYLADSTGKVDACRSTVTHNGLAGMIPQATLIKQADNPTHVILDNLCTEHMGSWLAVGKCSKATAPYPARMKYEYIPRRTRFTFANGQTSKVDWTPDCSIKPNCSIPPNHLC